MFEECIYFNLAALNRQITKIWQDEFQTLGLAPSHGYLLSALMANPEASQKDLSELMELDASTINRFMDALIAKNLIQRQSAGKGARFSLTEKGFSLGEKVHTIMANLFKDMQNTFGKQNFTHIVDQLHTARTTLKGQTA